MAVAPPIAKVSRPVPTGYFPRHRLYRHLDRLRSAPVVWITGPPGCGKTALVSSYVQSRRLAHLWYKVDEGDGDLATFFYYLGVAVRKAAPRKKTRLPLLTPERFPGISVFARQYFEALSSTLTAPFLLVLDDCERLPTDSPFFHTVREGLSRLAPGVGAVLISRADPPPCFSRERANRSMNVLGWEELRLDLAEAAGIVRLVRGGRPSGSVRELFERTDGWAAGLVLLCQRHDREMLEPPTLGEQVSADIVEYFGSEIFRRLDPETRLFLMRSAFLPRMTASMAEKISGAGHAGRILSDLNRQNVFTHKNSQQQPVYEYHALFREFLLGQARCAFSPETLTEIHKSAAAILEDAGYVEDAAELLRQGGAWESLARLVESRASALFAHGRHRTVLGWVGGLPAEVREHDPWVTYWTAIGLMPSSPGESRQLFEKAFRGFEVRQDITWLFRSWAGVVDASLSAVDDYSSLDPWIPLLPRLIERHGFPSGDVGDDVTCSMFAASLYCRPPGIDVDWWADRALAASRKSGRTELKIKCGVIWFLYKLGRGGFQDAEWSVAWLREILQNPDATPMMRLWVDWMEAALSIFVARPERCARVVSDGLAFGNEVGIHHVDQLLVGYGALGALHLGDVPTATRYLATMTTALPDVRPVIAGLYHYVLACDALGRRDLRKAALHAKESLKQLESGRNRAFLPTGYLLASHVHHAAGEDEEAAGHLAAARRVAVELDSPYAAWLSALSDAFFRFERGDDTSAIPVLRDAMRIGRDHGLAGTFFWRSGFLDTVAARALEHGIEVEYTRDLIRRNRLRPNPSGVDLEQWPWPVKVRTLGNFELLADGHPVQFGRKVQQRPLSLLKALIALGGQDVPVGHLEELLWPEAEGDRAHLSFTSALNRLRKLVATHEALVLKEGRLSLSAEHCWVDAWAFERFMRRANEARGARREHEADRLLSRALEIYQGEFLASDDTPWVVPARERLRHAHASAVAELPTGGGPSPATSIVGVSVSAHG